MPGHKLKKGDRIRAGKFLGTKVCYQCGKEKKLTAFPKRSGIYKKYAELDPRRFDTTCKLCKKPVRPGQDRSELTEPKNVRVSAAVRKSHADRKRKERERRRQRPANDQRRDRRRETRLQSMLYLAKRGCEECGERDPRKLEYDHKKPEDKHKPVSRLILDGFSWTAPTLRREVAKCRVLCSNCHRKHTIAQQDYYRDPEVQKLLGKLAGLYRFDL